MGLFGGGSQKVKPIAMTSSIHHGLDSLAKELYQNRVPTQLDSLTRNLRGLEGIAGQANPLLSSAGQLGQNVLSGGFLGANPYLQAAMQPAQQAYLDTVQQGQQGFLDTIGQIGSGAVSAGGTGRGSVANMQSRATTDLNRLQGNAQQQLADAMGRISYQNYGDERARQQQAMLGAGQLFNQQLMPLQIATQAGVQREARANEQYNRMLQQMQVLQGGPMGQSTSTGSNVLGNVLGAGMTGYSLGGPWGAAAGAGLGLLGGL